MRVRLSVPTRRGIIAAIGLASLCVLAWPASALNFELQEISAVEDGFPHIHWLLHYDDHTNVLIDLPRGWSNADDATSITSIPPNTRNAMIRIEKSSLTPATPFHDAGLDTYRQRLRASIPEGATNVRFSGEKPDPLPVFGWKDYELTVTYDFFGQALRRSVLYINLNTREQIIANVIAPEADFDKMHDQAMDVLRSWSPVAAN